MGGLPAPLYNMEFPVGTNMVPGFAARVAEAPAQAVPRCRPDCADDCQRCGDDYPQQLTCPFIWCGYVTHTDYELMVAHRMIVHLLEHHLDLWSEEPT